MVFAEWEAQLTTDGGGLDAAGGRTSSLEEPCPQMGERKGVQTVRAVEKALHVLEVMAEAGTPHALVELSSRAGMNTSTLYRLLTTLHAAGYVEFDPDTSRYRLSLKAYRIGQAAVAHLDVRETARPFMSKLVARCNETANLVVLQRREAVFIEQIVSASMMLRSFVGVGSRLPAHASGGGKVLLAALPTDRLRRLYREATLRRYTANTIRSLDALVEALSRVRRVGYAIDDEEREVGVRCVAAPIRDHRGAVVAALTVTGPAGRLTYELIEASLARLVRSTAAEVSAVLGHREDGDGPSDAGIRRLEAPIAPTNDG